MENEELKCQDTPEWACPCMPQCPNYGKCRECIAAHAKFYTAPKCVKLMQEEMKKNHLHPSNPHIKKALPERISEYYEQNPNAHLRTVAEALKITEWQLLDAMETAVSVPKAELDGILTKLSLLDKVRLHLDTGGVLLQLTAPLPTAVSQHGAMIFSGQNGDMSLTSLIFPEALYAVFLVRETLCGGKESMSIALVNEDEKIALSIYLCRSEDNTIEAISKELFEALWQKYKN